MDLRRAAILASLGGLITTAAVAAVVVLISQTIGLNVLSVSVLFIIPVGAVMCGAAALYGFYWTAHRYDLKPGIWMLAPLIALALIGYGGVHYAEYLLTSFPDGTPVSNVVGFRDYLDVMLTNQTMRVGRGARDTGVEVGEMGYWMALLDLVGFVVGGAWIYVALGQALACLSCGRYLRLRGSRSRVFATVAEADQYYAGVEAYDFKSDAFAECAALGTALLPKGQQPEMQIASTLHDCEGCHRQLWTDAPHVWSGKEWRPMPNMVRKMTISPEENVVRFFR